MLNAASCMVINFGIELFKVHAERTRFEQGHAEVFTIIKRVVFDFKSSVSLRCTIY